MNLLNDLLNEKKNKIETPPKNKEEILIETIELFPVLKNDIVFNILQTQEKETLTNPSKKINITIQEIIINEGSLQI